MSFSLNTINSNNPFAAFTQRFGNFGMLKSTQEKMERQQKAQDQISFFEQQKDNLKNMECSSLEEISRKLEMFHTYEDEIAAAKQAYNNEQMWHALDEAKELGEKIAEQAEKYEPKTAEERKEEMVEEALGTDEEKGEMTEALEDLQEELAEISEEMLEEAEEVLEQTEANQKALEQEADIQRAAQDEITDTAGNMPANVSDRMADELLMRKQQELNYVPIDIKV